MENKLSRGLTSQDLRNPNYYRIIPDNMAQARIEASLRRVVFGQERAIQAVGQAMLRAEAGMSDPSRPEFSALFAGPPGTGKTEMGAAIAYYLYPKNPRSRLLRIPCGSYQSEHDVHNITGAPQSYVGYGDKPQITPGFLQQGRTAIVFDEIEKSDPALQKLMLEILGAAVLDVPIKNDSSKEVERVTLDFSRCSIILTSNLGSGEMQSVKTGKRIGFRDINEAAPDINGVGLKAIEEYFKFRPEFLNRVDAVIIFNDLTKPVLYRILDKFIFQCNRYQRNPNPLGLTREVKDFVVSRTDPRLGGRELKRMFEELVVTPAAKAKPHLQRGQRFFADLNEKNEIIFFAAQMSNSSQPAPEAKPGEPVSVEPAKEPRRSYGY